MLTMIKKDSKTSAKALAKSAITLKTSIEFALQPLMEDSKMKEQLDKIAGDFQAIERALLEKSKAEPSELAKTFEKTEEELDKITKKINGFQEYKGLAEKSLQDKLLSKLNNLKVAKKDIKVQEDYKKQAERTITEIRTLLDNGQKKLTVLSDKAETALKQHKQLKSKVAVYSLPEHLNQGDKQAKKLKDRLELLSEASHDCAKLDLSALGLDKDKVKSFLPQLQSNIKSCGQLMEQVLINFKPLMVSNVATATTTAASTTSTIKLATLPTNIDAKNDSQFNKASIA